MHRLSVIADIESLLPDARKVGGEYSQINAAHQERLLRIVCSIHGITHKAFGKKRSLGPMTGIEDITDEAYLIAMDGWGRPNEATMAYWYSQAINEKIKAETESQNLIAIIMLSDMGDGDTLYRTDSLVFAPVTFSKLAVHSGMAREATLQEVNETLDGVEAYENRVRLAAFESQSARLRKAARIHAGAVAA